MAHPGAVATNHPAPRTDSRQARLDAAIALFRSEASASGYVVEEVRLRLPVPDVDVMPRVVIAQQNAASTPPVFPRSKHHRVLLSFPSVAGGDRPPLPLHELPHPNTANIAYDPSRKLPPEQIMPPKKNGGFKRTVSGSVIFHPVSARTLPPQVEHPQPGMQAPHVPQKIVPLNSVPYLQANEKKKVQRPTDSSKGQFWKTVIGSENGSKAILKAAESMHSMRHSEPSSAEIGPSDSSKLKTTMEVDRHASYPGADSKANIEHGSNRSPAEKKDTSASKHDCGESTLHINGHSIPESHVQLLLSSVADISARERISVSKPPTTSATVPPPGVKKGGAYHRQVGIEPNVVKSVPASHARTTSSRGRREGSDRSTGKSPVARPFRCTKCPSSFEREGHSRIHILAVHEKKRPFVCQVCDASFGHSSSLLRHVRTVHQASPVVGSGKLSTNPRSGQASNDSGSTKSGNVLEEQKDGSEKHFRCSACGLAFNRVALLNRHVAHKHPVQTFVAERDGSE